MKHARKSKERGNIDEEDISSLRQQLLEQEKLVKQLYESLHGKTPDGSEEKTSLLSNRLIPGPALSGMNIGSPMSAFSLVKPTISSSPPKSYGATLSVSNVTPQTNNNVVPLEATPKKQVIKDF